MDISGQILKIISLLDSANEALIDLGTALQHGEGEITLFKKEDERSVNEKFDAMYITEKEFEKNKKEQSEVISNENLIKKHTYGGGARRKPVIQCDLQTGKMLKKYDSITIASQATTINPTSISQCCRKQIRQAGGFLWKFVKED